VLSAFIIGGYLTPVLTSLILAYIFYPVYKWIFKKTNKKNLSAFIVSLLIILLLVIPLSFVMFQLVKEVNVGYILAKQRLATAGFDDGIFAGAFQAIEDLMKRPEFQLYTQQSLEKAFSNISEGALGFVFSLPARLLDVLLTFFFTFFLLRDGRGMVTRIEKKFPLQASHKKDIIKQTHEVIRGITYGFFVIAVIEGLLGGLTFALFGVGSPIIWGLVMAFLTFVPFIGAAVIWIPAAILKIFNGDVGPAIGIIAGGLIIAYIDTFVKPRVIGEKAAIHPAIILLGLLGGLKLLGFIGIIIGPIILSLLFLFIRIYVNKR
jgi:predicted PurR-regulated permease PerM